MLRFHVANKQEHYNIEHDHGLIEFGRGPARNDVPRCSIREDRYVSRDQLSVEEVGEGRARVINLSKTELVRLASGKTLGPGSSQELALPVCLSVGETLIEIDTLATEPPGNEVYQTIAHPIGAEGFLRVPGRLRFSLAEATEPQTLTQWFERVIAVQQAAAGSQEFYDQTAKALLDLVGLDHGLVLLRKGDGWQVAAEVGPEPNGPPFSQHIVQKVVRERRTFFQTGGAMPPTTSLYNIQDVVASPILLREEVAGVVYGSRRLAAGPGMVAIGPLEAQFVQILAAAVGTGMARMEREEELARQKVHFEKMKVEAEIERHRALAQMVAGVAHEINTPLGIVSVAVSLITERLSDSAVANQATSPELQAICNDVREAVEMIQGNLARANKLITSFKNLSVRQLTDSYEKVNLSVLIQELVSLFRIEARKANLTIGVVDQLAPGEAEWQGYPGFLAQVLMNFLANVERYAYPPGQGGAVEIVLGRGPAGFTLQVRDFGQGIGPENMAKVFEPFYTTGRSRGGTGLGLSIVHNLVTSALRGSVTVASELGKGTTFTVTLPPVVPPKAD